MYLLFADESGTPKPSHVVKPNEKFVLGSLILPDDSWPVIKQDFERIKKQYGVVGEIKWRHFFAHDRKGTLTHLPKQHKDSLRQEIFQMIARHHEITVIAVIVYQDEMYERFYVQTPNDLYAQAYKTLSERFQYFLQDITRANSNRRPQYGMLILDHRNGQDDKRLQQFHADLVHNQAKYASSYPNIVEGLMLAPSHHSVGIQLADMVGGAVYRLVAHNDDRYFRIIAPRIRRNPGGNLEGYGMISLRQK
ncbi:DUF3800 domain-containing protein [Rothia dentocariosa]|uniref:DUF3800 domain-containing protein n=1 Tax=Rothia dentocariosa TaxID=2047 RepID=UPI00145504CC|nr:DUF3800 domain-containing protein [Rothia dentocariosa]